MEQKLTINCVIGIDPGANGGIAVFILDGPVKVAKMPKDITDLQAFLNYYAENYKPIVFLEKLSVRPDDVKVDDGRAAMGKMFRIQKMMENFAQLKAVIEMSCVPYVLVHPMTWQTKLGLRIRGSQEEKADRKRRYRDHAARLYPAVNVALWNSDALLLMHFGRWALVNDTKWVKEQLPPREFEKLF